MGWRQRKSDQDIQLHGWLTNETISKEMQKSVDELRIEIKEALQAWRTAELKFQYASGHDEVELAIYQLMAAEQNYRLLLNKAKRMEVNWSVVKGEVV